GRRRYKFPLGKIVMFWGRTYEKLYPFFHGSNIINPASSVIILVTTGVALPLPFPDTGRPVCPGVQCFRRWNPPWRMQCKLEKNLAVAANFINKIVCNREFALLRFFNIVN